MSLKALLLGLVFALLWSSAYTAARIIVTYSPLGALSLRFFISGILALIIAKWLGKISNSQKTIASNNNFWCMPKYNLSRLKFRCITMD